MEAALASGFRLKQDSIVWENGGKRRNAPLQILSILPPHRRRTDILRREGFLFLVQDWSYLAIVITLITCGHMWSHVVTVITVITVIPMNHGRQDNCDHDGHHHCDHKYDCDHCGHCVCQWPEASLSMLKGSGDPRK